MRTTRGLKLMLLGLALCLMAFAAQAQVVKKSQGGLSDLVAVSSRTYIGGNLVDANAFRAESVATDTPAVRDTLAGWDRFISENGSSWNFMLDKRTSKAALISGSGIPWLPGKGNSLPETEQAVSTNRVVNQARQFIDRYPELFGVENSDLQVVPEGTGEFGGYLWYINLQRTFHGIPVEKSYVVFRVNHGNLVQFGGEFLGEIDLDPLPTISAETAQQILAGYIGGFQPGDEWADAPKISVIPLAPQGDVGVYNGQPGKGVDYALVYTLSFRRDAVMGTWQAQVDAHTGEVISFVDANEYGSVKGGIYVTSNLDTEVVRPMPFAGVGTSTYANSAGVYSATSGTVTGSFTGKYVKVTDSCGTSSLAVTAPADINFSTSSGTDCTTPGVGGSGNTHSARTGYYHLTLWKMKAMAWLPSNTWLTGQVGDKVNLNQTCNAYWDGSAVNFFKSGGGCSNTGELPTVFLHEIGHGLDSNDGSPSSTVGSSESYGDLNGILATHSSCLGINFIPGQQCSGYGNACTSCTGIRDADYTKHTNSTSPATPAQLSATSGFHCSKSSSYPGPCGYEGHCESYIMSEVGWDLAAKDLPTAGFDANTSWYIADRLFYLTRPTAGDSYTCSGTTANGCGTSNWHQVYLVADDDNGNLSDGTPHALAIYNAFSRHLIACTTSTKTNSTTCGTLGQVSLTATAGASQVSLSWAAISGAAKYQILRNELGATAGMTPLTTTTSTSYTDTAVATGVTYYYSVAAVASSNACFGALSTVKSATPTAGSTYSISGTVSGAATSGVTITLTGAASASTVTATGGTYSFAGLSAGSYTVTPSLSGYTFSPTSTSVTISTANATANFTATAVPTYTISGTVSGAATSGVTISLTGAASKSTVTATGGTYSFTGLAAGSYTVTPSLAGYSFSPTSTAVTISTANATANFTASVVTTTYSISGTVSGAATSGVTMTLTGAASASTVTGTGGTYTFSGLAAGGYTVTPSLTGYTFSPTSTSVTITSANATANFTATAVSGDTPLTSGVGVAGSVAASAYKYYTIAVPSGATALSITLTGLSADVDLYVNNSTTHPTTSSYYGRSWNSGTTSESLSYTSPTVATWSIAAYGYAAGNYTVTATVTTGTTTYSISGAVSGAVTSGVTMNLTGAASASTVTGTGGTYTFSGLANGTYTVTPSLSGYTFSPTSTSVTISGANQTGKNFTATSTGGQVTLFTNGFESTTGWAQVDTSGTAGTWSNVTSGTYPTCSVHGGSYMGKFNSYNAASGSATRYYQSTGFAISSIYTTVTMTFWMYHDTGYTTSADKIQPQVSTNSGSTWTAVGSAINRYDGSTGWKQHTVTLTTYKGSTVNLGFLATSAYGNNIYLDDVTVVAQ